MVKANLRCMFAFKKKRGGLGAALAKALTRGVPVAALLIGLTGCAWLQDQQRQLIYRPTPALGASASQQPVAPFYELTLPATDPTQQLSMWWLPQADPHAPTLLYLHGTFRNLIGNQRKIESLRSAGFSVLALDYRGWGASSRITPSESSIVQDTRLAWAELVRRQPQAGRRVIYGHSMGSGAAVALASELSAGEVGAVVLESAFTSFSDVAQAAGFWASLLNLFSPERFDSLARMGRVQAPLLMLHGALDDTIPVRLGERLFSAANHPKHWQIIAGAPHSDLDIVNPVVYQRSLRDFAAKYLSAPER